MCFTPMIMSDSFVKSAKARDNDFTTNEGKVYYCITNFFGMLKWLSSNMYV